jgi:hypothetical protein
MKRFLSWFRSPGGALIALGALSQVSRWAAVLWRWLTELETARSLWVDAGGSMPLFVNLVSSIWFSPALIVAGFAYTTGRWRLDATRRGRAYGQLMDAIGWLVFAACAVLLVSTIFFDSFLTESGASKFAQYVLDQKTERQLSGAQFQRILEVFNPVTADFTNVQVEAVSAAPDATGYVQKFMIAFHLAGMTVNGIKPDNNDQMLFPIPATVSSAQMTGLYIGVKDRDKPLDVAVRFRRLLTDAGFQSSFAPWNGIADDSFVFTISYK